FWGTIVENGTFSPLRQTYVILRVNMPFSSFVQRFEEAFMTKKFEDLSSALKSAIGAIPGLETSTFVIEKLIGIWNKNRLLAKPFPETTAVLEELKTKGLKIGLISNADCFSIEPLLERFDLAKYFDAMHLSWQTGFLKTNPKSFEILLRQLGVSKDETLMVGDSLETDIEGARKAGIRAILIDRKGKRDYPNKIGNLNELMRFL
ncbi:MAG: HAD family hydrolase, partial [Candidatus Woesearchaeota archaeon]